MIYPKHVAVIPDGNRTRAKANGKDLPQAYMTSYEKALEVIKYTFTYTDTKVFTLRWLSTENTKNRPREEFNFLMTMYKLIDSELDDFLIANKVNFKTIGDLSAITDDFKEYLTTKEQRTKCDSDRYLIFAINYGGRDEIIRGIKKLNAQNIDFGQITEDQISNALDLWNYPPIELVIRTKGDEAQRTSGFMSRRIGYAELYFTAKKCPEFEVKDYEESLKRFNAMAEKRNFGK